MTAQLLDKGFVTTGEILYEQRVLEHAARGNRSSVDSFLKHSNETVQALGRDILQHAKVQVARELQFLEDVNCVVKRPPSSSDSGDTTDAGAQNYFYFSKPDSMLKGFARPKDLIAFWDR